MFLAASADTSAASASDIGNWMIVAFALLTGVSTLLQVVAFFRPKPPLHETYATKAELDKLDARHAGETARLHGRISGLRDELTKSGDERAERILRAVGDLSRTVREDLGGVHARITAAERDISRVDERTRRPAGN